MHPGVEILAIPADSAPENDQRELRELNRELQDADRHATDLRRKLDASLYEHHSVNGIPLESLARLADMELIAVQRAVERHRSELAIERAQHGIERSARGIEWSRRESRSVPAP